jgi:hypothetical protein
MLPRTPGPSLVFDIAPTELYRYAMRVCTEHERSGVLDSRLGSVRMIVRSLDLPTLWMYYRIRRKANVRMRCRLTVVVIRPHLRPATTLVLYMLRVNRSDLRLSG